ncbi:unnamed protein product [Cylicocyclus nassatus]|uniref:Cytochrome c oxidase polypeptide VIIc n=1 Tax=Cylicocyclus nassatus TaxID=53992 RepID=A0AA36DUR1_CYLNA|nr:unnamed protein product [Cylicocyclus nassatus]
MLKKAVVPVVRAIRNCHHDNAPAKFTGQTPNGFIHDGWANARTPFSVANRWMFSIKATLFLAIGFWAPFAVVEYQLRKAKHMSVRAIAPFIRSVRNCSIKSPVKSDATKFVGQTPTSFIHDGWANARTPFSVANRWLFNVKAVAFLAIPFWAPFMVVEYQLKKANQ